MHKARIVEMASVVGMDAHRGPQTRISLGQLGREVAAGQVVADHQHL